MSFTVTGTPATSGVAIGRAVRVVSSRANVAHYFISPEQVQSEITRIRVARNAVMEEMARPQQSLTEHQHKDSPQELSALMDVHMMLLQDETLSGGVKHWIEERHYNAEWALTTQLEIIAAQFDEMHDPYMRERKADLEQVVEHLLKQLQGSQGTPAHALPESGEALILVAHDLSPSDMLQFKSGIFKGFVTDVGGKTSHTAIVARSLGIPAIVGAKNASLLVRQDDWVILDADVGVLVADPSPRILAEYQSKWQLAQQEQAVLDTFRFSVVTAPDGTPIEVLANIELPADTEAALKVGAQGIGLFRTEFLFMGRNQLPDEEEQYLAYKEVAQAMAGRPVTIRTIDIGADKPLEDMHLTGSTHLNPALGLRAIRWCLAEPAMFLTQLRALLRAAVHGPIDVLIPMLAHEREIKQTMLLIDRARLELEGQGVAYGQIGLGAMIEVPAAALIVDRFLHYFDFLSIGTNDLIQYTLAVDRADESVSHLYDPMHPAVQGLLAMVIDRSKKAGKPVSVCGEMAGDLNCTKGLLDMGLRVFSMHPSQVLAFKKHVKSLAG